MFIVLEAILSRQDIFHTIDLLRYQRFQKKMKKAKKGCVSQSKATELNLKYDNFFHIIRLTTCTLFTDSNIFEFHGLKGQKGRICS